MFLYPQKALHLLSDSSLELGSVVAVEFAALVISDGTPPGLTHLDVRPTLDVGFGEHTQDAEKYTPHTLDR